jgi:hypothetical protein
LESVKRDTSHLSITLTASSAIIGNWKEQHIQPIKTEEKERTGFDLFRKYKLANIKITQLPQKKWIGKAWCGSHKLQRLIDK